MEPSNSDPIISSMRRLPKKNLQNLPEEAVDLIISDEYGNSDDDSEDVDDDDNDDDDDDVDEDDDDVSEGDNYYNESLDTDDIDIK
ncbi:trigger factor-like [Zeugodacus cucurbitae]|uniref:trigger factor-like n=1 Tax=Zeugodacus cucurbitae TaxID=28588 RepID=UPI0023D8F5DB|nr:trigger factor-like [Zeugodacus cucurbitae]